MFDIFLIFFGDIDITGWRLWDWGPGDILRG